MHSLTTLLPTLLLLLSPATAAHGPYIPSGFGTGTAHYPYPTGTGSLPHYPTAPYPTAPLSSGPSEAATTCPLPITVITTTQVTVTVTVPAVSGGGSTGVVGTGTGTGVVGPTASGGLKRRMEMEMRGLGEERKERKRGFWA